MKKFLFILLAAALTLPLMAQVTPVLKNRGHDRVDRTADTRVLKSVKAFDGNFEMQLKGRAFTDYVWDFETEEDLANWSSYDADGDGYGWEIDDYYAFSGIQSVTSRSYYGGEILFPDNWLISPNVAMGGELKFWAMNYLSFYPEKFKIYLILGDELTVESIDAAIPVTDFITPPEEWTEYTIDLSTYSGTGYFAIRHYDCSDEFRVLIDYITLSAPAVPAPQNVTVDPAATTAEVAWEEAENVAWNLRYREAVEIESLVWNFEDEAQLAEWEFIDEDGDGHNWTYFNMTGVTSNRMTPNSGEGLMSSASYDKDLGLPLSPDNWLVSPQVKLDGKLALWAAGQDPEYAEEVFGVYVSTDKLNWYQIGDDITATGSYTEYTFDLTECGGVDGYFAIRHYNVVDMFWLNIDDVSITYGEPNEWIVVEDVTSPYTIEGLNPETNYEVEVQGVNDEGLVSGWTPVVAFTTLANDVPPVEPTEKTGAPTFLGHTEDGIHAYFVEIIPTEPSVIYYRVIYPDGTESEWAVYEDILSFVGEGKYRVEAYAVADGKLPSEQIAYEFVVAPVTGIDEMVSGKQVAGVRYFNAAGQEMSEANGLTIVVTTYTDGTTSATKVVK